MESRKPITDSARGVAKSAAGEWLLRLAGTGAYSVAVQAHAAQGLHNVEVQEEMLSLRKSLIRSSG